VIQEAPDRWALYRQMLASRLFEEAARLLWEAGDITGEIHSGVGEEGIIAGIVSQLREGDGLSLDHRGTAAMLMRGVDPVLLLRELLGRRDGLCRGQGGHMHLFSKDHLAISSGIVGAAAPAAVGLALAGKHLRPGALAVAFFGEGAMNQGMLLESLNLAAVWRLPVVFVCKDDSWSITTRSESVRGGALCDRARSMGLEAIEVDGRDVESVWSAAQPALAKVRAGGVPCFVHAHCTHMEGHMLGYRLFRVARSPLQEGRPLAGSLARAVLERNGGPRTERLRRLAEVAAGPREALNVQTRAEDDPVLRLRGRLRGDRARLSALEDDTERAIGEAVQEALAPPGRGDEDTRL
jgi:pyruvate dehydrogenase E1 component alpha subunit